MDEHSDANTRVVTGKHRDKTPVTCPRCGGNKTVIVGGDGDGSDNSESQQTVTCPICNGKGTV